MKTSELTIALYIRRETVECCVNLLQIYSTRATAQRAAVRDVTGEKEEYLAHCHYFIDKICQYMP